MRISDLWRLDGGLGRGAYAGWGLGLVALKYNLDRLVAGSFGHRWTVFDYWQAPDQMPLLQVGATQLPFYVALLMLALPFVFAGVVLTLKRLRDAGLPTWLVVLFFLPVVNLLFFATLCVLPSRAVLDAEPASGKGRLAAFVPKSQAGAAAMGILVTAAVAMVFVAGAVYALGEYGWGIFVGVPFCLGLSSVLVYGYHRPRPLGACLTVACLAAAMTGLGLLAAAVEGVICLAMAAPIGLALAALGGLVGYWMQRGRGASGVMPQVLGVLLLALPMLMGAETLDPAKPTLYAVTTDVTIDAPPATVWRNVVTFSDLPDPDEWLFKTGIAYPLRATITGTGVGAVRRCEFSTGAFVEPITVWDAPRELRFDVVSQPPAMRELSPWGAIDAPHLDHFLVSEGGRFALTALPGGGTRLAGTTWYRHRIWPAPYWHVWSDAILHRIHGRVLRHFKALSEG